MQIKRYLTIALGIMGSIVILAGLGVGVKLVQQRQDIRNFAAENSCKKVVGGITCSWSTTNSNDQPYYLDSFYAKVQVEQNINSSWIPLSIGPNSTPYLYVDADNNGEVINPTEGSVFIPNVLLSADQGYRCKVDLVIKNKSIGEQFCGVKSSFISNSSSCPIGGLSSQQTPIVPETDTPFLPLQPTFTVLSPLDERAFEPAPIVADISSCEEAAVHCPKVQPGQPGLAVGTYERIHQLRKEDLIKSNITSSSSTYDVTVTNPRNNLICSCSTTVYFPYCKAPRALGTEDGYPADNCQNGCNFFFIYPGQDTCLSYADPKARIKLLYSDGGSINFDDASHYSTSYFNDYDNPIFFDYTYSSPGVYDVTLTCNNLPAGSGSCSKRIVVGNPGTDSTSTNLQLQSPSLKENEPKMCIENDPAIEVKLDIERCTECQ